MPKRTNIFQEIVAIVHAHLSHAVVEESAMLPSRTTGKPREVDAVIRAKIATYEVIVGVEATKGGRRATVEWVERMLGKHADLPTNKLILASQSGFSEEARVRAEAAGAVAIAPVDFESGRAGGDIVGHLEALWSKYVTLTPARASAFIGVCCRPRCLAMIRQDCVET